LWDNFVLAAMFLILCCPGTFACAQSEPKLDSTPGKLEQKVERLTAAMAQAQAQIEADQKQLLELRLQLIELQREMAEEKTAPPATKAETAKSCTVQASSCVSATLNEIKEQQAIEGSQIATLDMTKVETESKYPLKVSGLILFNGFVNTRQVDIAASPAYALPGSGSTGLSLRQTVLGLDARGPHLFGATSHADLRVDFFAYAAQSSYASSGVLRMRTAHAEFNWQNTEAFVELDRAILEPNAPSSLVAVGQPELAWAGNLWSWNPQAGVSHQFVLSDASRIKAQAALIDTSDPQPPGYASAPAPATQTELSRWPGTEARIAFQHGENGIGPEIGVGGYFSPHRTLEGDRFDAWAGTVDLRLPLTRHFEITTNAYRGQALAGLGGGGYVNYLYQYFGSTEVARALSDAGGWTQLKARAGKRVEMNTGYGIDNPFAKEIQAAALSYPELARNRSFFSNAIFSPSAYLLFSLEYKRLWSNYNTGPTNFSDVIGIGAGYRF
ncbi:MAG: hypothetical protein WAK26_03875, partial [Terracidiphilus sp.]